MNQNQLESMSIDDLWEFHQKVSSVLEKRIRNKIHSLENMVEVLLEFSCQTCNLQKFPKRRRYPKVLPKFQKPKRRSAKGLRRGRVA